MTTLYSLGQTLYFPLNYTIQSFTIIEIRIISTGNIYYASTGNPKLETELYVLYSDVKALLLAQIALL